MFGVEMEIHSGYSMQGYMVWSNSTCLHERKSKDTPPILQVNGFGLSTISSLLALLSSRFHLQL